jgi:hypothetical protein
LTRADGTRATRSRRATWRAVLAFVYAPALLLVVGVGVVGGTTGVSVAQLTRDTVSLAGVPLYTGAISNLGILLWCATAAVCLLTALVLRARGGELGGRPEAAGFLLGAGLLTAALLVDDAFLLHEGVAPRFYGHVGTNLLFALYGAATAWVLWRGRHVIARSEAGLLALALAFLVASVGVDEIHDFGLFSLSPAGFDELGLLLEDGVKLLGIAGWLGYFGTTCYQLLTAPDSRADTSA